MAQYGMTGGIKPGRSVFDLSYEKKFTADMGLIYPVLHDEMVPGDRFQIGNEVVIRMNPLVAPILHEINAFVHYFFVPYRLLWPRWVPPDGNDVTEILNGWEAFITGGPEGNYSPLPPTHTVDSNFNGKGALWDYFGFPIAPLTAGATLSLSAWPILAYNYIYNEYYRDQNLQDPVVNRPQLANNADGLSGTDFVGNTQLLYRNWEKDYFTSCLPWQQRGDAPGLPVTGTLSASRALNVPFFPADESTAHTFSATQAALGVVDVDLGQNPVIGTTYTPKVPAAEIEQAVTFDASTFDVADMRLAFQLQKWLERQARGGARYIETLRSHFGVSPRDSRLQRPEYIGGSKTPVIISEVLQTSSTDGTTPQGNLAGHGITIDKTFVASYRAEEFGIVMGLLSIMPRPNYSQGIDRQWTRTTRWDYYWPEFAHLSEQAVRTQEIYATGTATDDDIFGYQGRYDEMRVKKNLFCGGMRDTFSYWHLGREFSSPPLLNSDFIQCRPDKRIFAVPSEPGFIVNFGNVIRAVRPIPSMSNPGFIDHS